MNRAGQIWSASRLAELPERYRTALLPISVERTYARGELVGASNPRISLVISGQICGYLVGHSGRRVAYRYYDSGDIIGLLAITRLKADRSAAPIEYAAARNTRMLEFPAGRLCAMLTDDAPTIQYLSQLLAQDLLEGRRGLAAYAFLSVRQMLALHLLKRAVHAGDQLVVEATQEELASAIGSVRAVVARTLVELRAEGLIDRVRHGILIMNTGALAAEAKGQRLDGSTQPEPDLPPGSIPRSIDQMMPPRKRI